MRFLIPIFLLAVASPGHTEEPDWLGLRTDLENWSRQLESREPLPESSQRALSQDFEVRAFCGMDDQAFMAQLISQNCDQDGCAGRPAMVKRTIDTLASEVDGSMSAARAQDELPFVPAASDFPSRPPEAGDRIVYRAAADLWLRNFTNAAAGDSEQHDRFFIGMRAWCRLIERNTAAAVSFTQQYGFPQDDSLQRRRQAAAIVYIAQHSAMDYTAMSALRKHAEETFRRGGLSPYYMGQILDVEREAYDGRQVVGHLTSCVAGRASFDPPLVNVTLAEQWRAANGLSTTGAYLEGVSRRCV